MLVRTTDPLQSEWKWLSWKQVYGSTLSPIDTLKTTQHMIARSHF